MEERLRKATPVFGSKVTESLAEPVALQPFSASPWKEMTRYSRLRHDVLSLDLRSDWTAIRQLVETVSCTGAVSHLPSDRLIRDIPD
jgi:hypothetical protein